MIFFSCYKAGMTNEEFKAALDEMGITQRRFAAISGAHANMVSRWALGKARVSPVAAALLREMREPGAWRKVEPPA
jgi:DNA-binding transcriptional regulator YiaG